MVKDCSSYSGFLCQERKMHLQTVYQLMHIWSDQSRQVQDKFKLVILEDFNARVDTDHQIGDFVCVEVLQPSQPYGVMSSAVSLPNYTFTGQA